MNIRVQRVTETSSQSVSWVPCIAMTAVSLISYVDRSVLSILSPTILQDLHLSATQYGLAVSTFSICYMLANPVWGKTIDRMGLFWSICAAVALWSIASGAHALVFTLAGLCVARGALGFGEGATFPAGYKIVSETLPEGKRSFGIGLSYSGGALGAIITPLIVTPLAAHFGWRAAFLFTAVVGMFWILSWTVIKRLGLYRDTRVAVGTNLTPTSGSSLQERRAMIATALLYGTGALPLAFGLYSAPFFLSRVLHQSQSSLGYLLWIPPLGWEVGYLAFGKLADRGKIPLNSRPELVFWVLSTASLLLGVIPFVQSVGLTMLLFFASMFIAAGFVVLPLTHGLRTVQASKSALLAGACVAVWSLLVAALMPVIGEMFDSRNYSHAFWLVAVIPLIGTASWLGVRSRCKMPSKQETSSSTFNE